MGTIDPKTTGGGGFDFEDKIGAYFLSFLLNGQEPFPSLPLGRLTTIKFQRKVDGWEFDDIILVFDSGGLEKQCAFSVKSNPQISSNRFPSDLVNLIWQQYCKTEENPFNPEYDYLGLITSGTSTAATRSYRELHKLAYKHQGDDLEIHINKSGFTNQAVRDLYKSFEKPSSIDCTPSIQRIKIIKKLIHCDINFDDLMSPHLKEALNNLELALSEGNTNNLWVKLQNMTKESRIVSGEINFATIIEELKDSFQIKGHYNLDSDLRKLKTLQKIEVEKIKSTIGRSLSIERK